MKVRTRQNAAGFSLIELIVVVAIITTLVAIAIPVFAGIQERAQQSMLTAAAANGASAVAATLARDGGTDPTPDVAAASAGSAGITTELYGSGNTEVKDTCVKASKGGEWAIAGPGCSAPFHSWP